MRSDSDLHETRTNAEHSETGGDLRVSYESLDFPAQWKLCEEAVARDRLKAKGDLYFIRAGDAVKIGRTTNIVHRLTNMQTNNHLDIDCVLLIKGQGAQEEAWHKRFKRDRIRGEWFRWSPDLEAAVLDAREVNRGNADAPKLRGGSHG